VIGIVEKCLAIHHVLELITRQDGREEVVDMIPRSREQNPRSRMPDPERYSGALGVPANRHGSQQERSGPSLLLDFLSFIEEAPSLSVDDLMARVLVKCREMTQAEAGTIFISRTESESEGARSWLEPGSIQNDAVPLEPAKFTVPMEKKSIAGFVALTSETLLIDDLYRIPTGRPYGFNKDFDRKNSYRSRSMLCFPLLTRDRSVIGVVQLINRRGTKPKEVLPFTESQAELTRAVGQIIGNTLERVDRLERLTRENETLRNRIAELESKLSG